MAQVLNEQIRQEEELLRKWGEERSISVRCCRIEAAGRDVMRLRPWIERREQPWRNRAGHFAQPGELRAQRTQAQLGPTSFRYCRSGNAAQAT